MFSLFSSSFITETYLTEQQLENFENNEERVESIKEHSYRIASNELLNPEKIVKTILESECLECQKKMVELESKNSTDAKLFKKEDSYWQDKEELYLEIEKWIRENNDKIPSWQVAGPLNYGMLLEEMKDAITKKFKAMVFSGNLMTEEQLTKNHIREIFYPTTVRGSDKLTRIWGAEFLKSNLVGDTTLDAAEHFLIVDDSASEIEVQVWHDEYPYLSIVNNAHILSQKIEGIEKAWEYRCSVKLNELRYRDFKDPGNIICDSKGKGWVVDTELKGFDHPKLSGDLYLIKDYLKKRFKVLAGEKHSCLYQTFKISVADLKLK